MFQIDWLPGFLEKKLEAGKLCARSVFLVRFIDVLLSAFLMRFWNGSLYGSVTVCMAIVLANIEINQHNFQYTF